MNFVARFLLMAIDFSIIHVLPVVHHFHFAAMVAHYFQQPLLVMVVDFLGVLEFQQISTPPHLCQ